MSHLSRLSALWPASCRRRLSSSRLSTRSLLLLLKSTRLLPALVTLVWRCTSRTQSTPCTVEYSTKINSQLSAKDFSLSYSLPRWRVSGRLGVCAAPAWRWGGRPGACRGSSSPWQQWVLSGNLQPRVNCWPSAQSLPSGSGGSGMAMQTHYTRPVLLNSETEN